MSSFAGPIADLYDVFVDWPGRLGRELPGLLAHLERAGAHRVLDAGCGTGRHVRALLDAGYDADGADPAPQMRARATALVGAERVHDWALGDPLAPSLRSAQPFDAVIAMGNVWPQVTGQGAPERAARGVLELLRPGGLVLLGLKAFALRLASGEPHLPPLRRVHGGRPLWFLRFLDAASAGSEDPEDVDRGEVDFHMAIVAGDSRSPAEALDHRVTRVRAWSPQGLERLFRAATFDAVRVAGKLDDPTAPVASEDVFLDARAPDRSR